MPHEKTMETMEKIYKVVPESSPSSPGKTAEDIATETGMHRTTVFKYLRHLVLTNKVENNKGRYIKERKNADEETEQTAITEAKAVRDRILHQLEDIRILASEDPKKAFCQMYIIVAQLPKKLREAIEPLLFAFGKWSSLKKEDNTQKDACFLAVYSLVGIIVDDLEIFCKGAGILSYLEKREIDNLRENVKNLFKTDISS